MRREGLSGRGLAIAGLCLSIFGLLLFVLFLVGVSIDDPEEDEAYWEDLEIGACVGEEDVFTATTVSCDSPHGAQVYAVLDGRGRLPEAYPGRNQLAEPARAACEPLFAQHFGGESGAASDLVSRPVLPSEIAWEHGERWIVCLVERGDGGDLTRSVLQGER